MMFEQKTEIIFNKNVALKTFLLGIRSQEIAAHAIPGQFVMLRIGKGPDPLLRRPFSISGTRDQDLVLILYKVVGKGTALLQEKRAGEGLSVLGPLGRGFGLPDDEQVPLLVAGGIGVAPLFFLAQTIHTTNTQIMMGFGSSNEIIPVDVMGDFKIQYSISTDDGTHGHGGLVTELLATSLEKHTWHPSSLSLFSCGPKPMLKRVAEMALEHHIPCQVSIEAVMACGMGACQGCVVRSGSHETQTYQYVCKDGPVFFSHQIDWNQP
ncbi:MAG: dihydroorotate dehydrogenase electron transfer subunit [Deltaproteobacteria bacterium]|nr:dihydroorotate dehydrogenase electron transfer subunit [Deltaproteobacteria bacterium]